MIAAVNVCIFVDGYDVSMLFLVSARGSGLRAIIMMLEAPAMARLLTIEKPMPAVPPVMRIVLPRAESEGLEGDIASYVFL